MTTADEMTTPEQRWKHLREEGIKRLVDMSDSKMIEEKPKWFDEQRFKKARQTVHQFFIGVQFSSLSGLLLVLQLPDALESLLSTGNSKDIPSLNRRYMSTILHVESWYDDDVFDSSTKGYKSIRQVRAMHKRVQTNMNQKFKVSDTNGQPRAWFNHYDVALTQFAFIGLAMLYPQKSAMIGARDEHLEDINYYWRVLGHLMGVADEFNACHFDKYEDIREFNRLIFEHEYLDNFQQYPCPKGLEMSQSICKALHYYIPMATFNSLANWWSDCFWFNGYEPQPMSAREKMLDMWTRLTFNHLLKNPAVMKLSNKVHRNIFRQRLKRKDKVYEKLKEKHRDSTQFTYYSDRFDYFNFRPDSETQSSQLDISKTKESSACPFGFGGIKRQEEQQQPHLVASA